MAHLLGYDIGTSATKVILCEASGVILGSASAAYDLHQPRAGWSEQQPEDWWKAVIDATRRLLADHRTAEIAAIGLTGQMHGSVLLGADAAKSGGRALPLREALLWNDQRTQAECEQITVAAGSTRSLVTLVGNAALTGFTLPKLLWVRTHEPRTWEQVRHVLNPKDFIAFRLTGELRADVGDASGTLLCDVDARSWSGEMCRRVGIDPSLLPPMLESTSVAGHLTPHAAAAVGLPSRPIPVIIGSGDNQAGAVGAGVIEPGRALTILGTSGVLFAPTASPRRDLPATGPVGRLHTFCAAAGPASWCMTGCMLSAGLSLRFARDLLCPGSNYDAVMDEAASAPPGCEGLLFLPYLTGERCPHPDPQARGGWVGLTSRHTRAHFLRAVIEGVTFSMRQIIGIARDSGVPITSLRVTGGGNRSAFWRQLQADLYACPLATTSSEDGGGAFGAALLASVGAELHGGVREACDACVQEVHRTEPREVDALLLEAAHRFEGMYARLHDARM